jgi:hypothetical protein
MMIRVSETSPVPVKRHRGEPGHTRDTGQTRDTRTAEPHNHPNPPTHPRDRETTESAADSTAAAPEPTAPRGRLGGGRPLRTRPSRIPLPSAVMALATVRRNCVSTPRRGSSEGASLTASVTALLRVPGGAEVRGFGVRERLITHMVHARQGPGITRDAPLAVQMAPVPVHVRLVCVPLCVRVSRER